MLMQAGPFSRHDAELIQVLFVTYSAGQKKRYEHCCMKQKWQIQMGIAQHKIATTPLNT